MRNRKGSRKLSAKDSRRAQKRRDESSRPEAEAGLNTFLDIALMREEWEAWQAVVRAWPGDINHPDYNACVAAIRLWGEWLAGLRFGQVEAIKERAMFEAKKAYAKAKG